MTFSNGEAQHQQSFTDADLKRLKEAAEACIPHVYANRERFRALEKWRKAAGK